MSYKLSEVLIKSIILFMHTYNSGTFLVDENGEFEVDYLFDGGWFRGELAVFSVEGMENLTPGSEEFMLEAARRALTNSDLGRIVVRDEIEGARFSADFSWERNFNTDFQQYTEPKTFSMTPGDEVGLMLVQHSSVQETINNPENISQFGTLPIFSIPEANLSGASENRFNFVDINGTGTIGLEDIPTAESGGDYNDMVVQFVGLDDNFVSFEDNVSSARDWRETEIGQGLLGYANVREAASEIIDLDADVSLPSEDSLLSTSETNAIDPTSELTDLDTGDVSLLSEDYLLFTPEADTEDIITSEIIDLGVVEEPIGLGKPAVEDGLSSGDDLLEVTVGDVGNNETISLFQ